ncbi:dolichol-phosphate mannosyltransferase [Nosema bombycis CQ1]|uniref:Dolichol-phosphate mannosyltransferase subunit 1 n=1 Tax=Nosema bombycis (strain CQ1 / CVCC 102059) TaxID=578461 RepID=R0KSX6_NOSB1|nr:dolichol-phosphate mannosyltransferase [Nosema bombycis CQ1]|eukprot:EOB13327.1 dolichol-phosphate mannosyltransferase [Nosema bombycis CQ1]
MYNIIIPTYNEVENITILLKMIIKEMEILGKPFKIIVIDDNSPDGTLKKVIQMNNPNIVHLERSGKLGLGTAYKFAVDHCKFPFTIIMDADLSHDPIYIKKMIEIQEDKDADIVSGTRYYGGGVHGWSFLRRLTSRCANNIAKLMLNLDSSDLTGSYRLYKTSVLSLLLEKSISKGYAIQMELICRAEAENLKIYEQPIVFYERDKGKSKISPYEFMNFMVVVMKLFWVV